MADRPLLVAEGLCVRFAGAARDAIRDVTMAINHGERVGVLGPSGSGKSTLALALVGAIPHLIEAERHGAIRWDGVATQPLLAAGSGLAAFVQQDVDAQLVSLTVEDELAFALENRGFATKEIDRRLADWLQRPPALGLSRTDETLKLSAGWRQRLALAAALAEEPRVLVIDEPTAHLDESAAGSALTAMSEAAADGAAVLMIEHRADLVAPCADRLLVLDHTGAVFADGSPADVLERVAARPELGIRQPPALVAARVLRHSGLLPEISGCLTDSGLLDQLGARRNDAQVRTTIADALVPPRRHPGIIAGPSLLSLDGVDLHRAGKRVLGSISLDIRAGETIGITGRNGAGKTSLALLAAGVLRPSAGRITGRGDVPPVMVPQNPELVFARPTLTLEAQRRGLSWPEAARSLEAFGIDPDPDRHPLRHSHGQMRRIALALTLARKRSCLVVLDEPTAGLDVNGCMMLQQSLEAVREAGCGILLVSHDLEWLAGSSERILVLEQGAVQAHDRSDMICYRAALGELALMPPPGIRLAVRFGWTPADA